MTTPWVGLLRSRSWSLHGQLTYIHNQVLETAQQKWERLLGSSSRGEIPKCSRRRPRCLPEPQQGCGGQAGTGRSSSRLRVLVALGRVGCVLTLRPTPDLTSAFSSAQAMWTKNSDLTAVPLPGREQLSSGLF